MKKLVITFLLFGLFFNLRSQSGTLDTTFNTDMIIDLPVHATAVQDDGKILVGGDFFVFPDTTIFGIIRLNTDGTLDTSFQGGNSIGGKVWALAIQPDGKIVAVGGFASRNGKEKSIARLNKDGTLDTTFHANIDYSSEIYTVSIQQDGKILVGGWFNSVAGKERNHIARLNSDGSLDQTFDPGNGANDVVATMSILSNGKIIIGGTFTAYDGVERNRVARINQNGSLDPTFQPGGGPDGRLFATAIGGAGEIYIGGDFGAYGITVRANIARINSNGSLNFDFKPTSNISGPVRSIEMQSNGKLLIGGRFWNSIYGGRSRIARLHTNGSLDTTFDPGQGPDAPASEVETVSLQENGKVIVGGEFATWNGATRNGIARLNNHIVNGTGKTRGKPEITISPNPTRGRFTVKGAVGQMVVVSNLQGMFLKKVDTGSEIDLRGFSSGIYLVEVAGQTKKLLLTK